MSALELVHLSLHAGLSFPNPGGPPSSALRIQSLAQLAQGQPVSLAGCSLLFYVQSTDVANTEQQISVTFRDVEGRESNQTHVIKFGEPAEGLRRAEVIVQLNGLAVTGPGEAGFVIADGSGAVLGTCPLKVAPLGRNAVAVFGAFLQDEQGIAGGERYLSARLPFMLAAPDGSFSGYSVVRVSQRAGGNFEEDPLVLDFAPGWERLRNAYGFTTAVHTAFHNYSSRAFGGRLSNDSHVVMRNNAFIERQEIAFELPDEDAKPSGW